MALLAVGILCVGLADMHSGDGFKVLTAGLLRVELAPEEYQLYSEGCGWEEDRTRDQHEDRPQVRGATVGCCGGDNAEMLTEKHSEDLQLLKCGLSRKGWCRRK